MSQEKRPITEAEATIVYQAATIAGQDKQIGQLNRTVEQLVQTNQTLRALVPDRALANDKVRSDYEKAMKADNEAYAKETGKPPADSPAGGGTPPPAANDANTSNVATLPRGGKARKR